MALVAYYKMCRITWGCHLKSHRKCDFIFSFFSYLAFYFFNISAHLIYVAYIPETFFPQENAMIFQFSLLRFRRYREMPWHSVTSDVVLCYVCRLHNKQYIFSCKVVFCLAQTTRIWASLLSRQIGCWCLLWDVYWHRSLNQDTISRCVSVQQVSDCVSKAICRPLVWVKRVDYRSLHVKSVYFLEGQWRGFDLVIVS